MAQIKKLIIIIKVPKEPEGIIIKSEKVGPPTSLRALPYALSGIC